MCLPCNYVCVCVYVYLAIICVHVSFYCANLTQVLLQSVHLCINTIAKLVSVCTGCACHDVNVSVMVLSRRDISIVKRETTSVVRSSHCHISTVNKRIFCCFLKSEARLCQRSCFLLALFFGKYCNLIQ
jgi:hypothetical protein